MEREIRIHSQLFHQNIVSLYAAFEDADHVYLAQEYAAGASCTDANLQSATIGLASVCKFSCITSHNLTHIV